MPRLRLGVALLVPPPHDREVDTLRRAVGDPTYGRIPSHVTLVPPVNVREDRLGDALGVLRRAAADTRPFRVVLGPPASFLPDNPVLYLPVREGEEEIRKLRSLVFREPLERPLSWPFVPHVTIADEASPERIVAAEAALADYGVNLALERVHLLQEGPGRVWATLADAAFGKPSVVGRGGLEVELAVTNELDPAARAFAEEAWAGHDLAEFGPGMRWREDRVAITARREGTIVGVAVGWSAGGTAHLEDLVVHPAHRGEGVGSRLLAAFEAVAAERGCVSVTMRALAGGRAERFYRGRGWSEEARFRSRVFGRDLVQLRRDLPTLR